MSEHHTLTETPLTCGCLHIGVPGRYAEDLARDAERAIDAGNRAVDRASALTALVAELERDLQAIADSHSHGNAAARELAKDALRRIADVMERAR